MIPQCCPGERCEVVVGHRGHWYLAARRLVKPVGVVVGHWPDVGTGGHLATRLPGAGAGVAGGVGGCRRRTLTGCRGRAGAELGHRVSLERELPV